ncbi:MAG TPA: DUF2937 family protein [Parachlamydiaceae bacterium]|nr:DUF2937 family protein [Parachlamydiaceae bacterium]
MLKWLGGLLDRSFAVVGAIVFAQAPLFMQQYTQQMVGRAAELSLQVDALRKSAGISGKTIEQLSQKFIENSDPDIMRQGELMLATIGRWHSITDGLTAMQESSIWSRPAAFIYHLNTEAFSSTLHQFKMGLPFNMEGGAYALLGVVAGYLIFAIFRNILRQINNLGMRMLQRSPQKQVS